MRSLVGGPADKYETELSFQITWAKEFKQDEVRARVLEYWREYRSLDEIMSVCNIRGDTRVLDVGCGISTVLHYIPGIRCGIDPLANEYLKLYDYPKELDIRAGAGEAIPFPDGHFDVVFCSNVLDHVTSPEQTVDGIHRVLKPAGYFVLIVELFDRAQKRDAAHPHSLTYGGVQLLLEDRFQTVFERRSPWVGARAYVKGQRHGEQRQYVAVTQRLAGRAEARGDVREGYP